jgi:hypothetical protein
MTRGAPSWNDWLKDVPAGLLCNGVRMEEIKIQHHADGTVVTVRGLPKYEWKLSAGPCPT